ncbi:hypothetical protein SUGI_0344880 [Cryptomeria japonica]|nr:hypothetical protein SUGI_0344880 [Cryptomeria japonica]
MSKRIVVKREVTEIFPGLSEEVARECLSRVPCTSFFNLRAVCRSWRTVMSDPLFYLDRKRLGRAEDLLVIVEVFPLSYDQARFRLTPLSYDQPCVKFIIYHCPSNSFGRLPPIPTESGLPYNYSYGSSHCINLGHRLIVIGLVGPDKKGIMGPLEATFVYDFCSCRWEKGANMVVGRWGFSCALDSINGLIYTAGGRDRDNIMVFEGEVYNVEEDEWSLLPPMPTIVNRCSTAFRNGKFFVLCNYFYSECAQVYDSNTKLWTCVNFERDSPCVSGCESLYFFDCYKVGDYNVCEKEVSVIGLFSPGMEFVECAKLWYDQISVGENVSQDMVFKLYEPSSEEGGYPGMWTTVKRRKSMQPFTRDYFFSAQDYSYYEFSVAHIKI